MVPERNSDTSEELDAARRREGDHQGAPEQLLLAAFANLHADW